jgi:hypothetical protein
MTSGPASQECAAGHFLFVPASHLDFGQSRFDEIGVVVNAVVGETKNDGSDLPAFGTIIVDGKPLAHGIERLAHGGQGGFIEVGS